MTEEFVTFAAEKEGQRQKIAQLVLHCMVPHIKHPLQLRTQKPLLILMLPSQTGRPLERSETFVPRPQQRTALRKNAVEQQDTDAEGQGVKHPNVQKAALRARPAQRSLIK